MGKSVATTPVETTEEVLPVVDTVSIEEALPTEEVLPVEETLPVEEVLPVVEEPTMANPFESVVILPPSITEQTLMNRSLGTTEQLAMMDEKVHRYYPSTEGNSKPMTATINEYSYTVPRDKDVEVPMMFAEIFDRIRRNETGQDIDRSLLYETTKNKILDRI